VSSRRPTRLVAGNWKMNTSVADGLDLARALRAELDGSGVEVEVLPPFTHLVGVRDVLRGSSLRLGAQNCYAEDKGAFTGEISPVMLADICDDVLLGHSERRHVLG